MRLLIISGFWPTPTNPITGVFVQQQVEAYLKLGCEVTVIVPQTFRGRSQSRPYRQRLESAEVFCPTVMDVPQALSGGRLAVRFNARSVRSAITRTLKRHAIGQQFDGIHIHDLRYAALSYPQWCQSVSGTAVVTLHGVDPFVDRRAHRPWFTERLTALWERANRVVLVGSPLRTYARRLGAPENKLSIVPNGSVLPETWNTSQRPLNQRRVIVSVSNLVALKGIDLNLRALAEIKAQEPELDWTYRIIGDGPERDSLGMLCEQLKIADQVRFLGRLDHAATLAEIAAADVFALPSWGENFGIVYLEAMGRGRPVIGCRQWGAADIFENATEGLLVEPGDVETLKRALQCLLSNPDRCEDMGSRGRMTAEKFTWSQNARRYLDLMVESGTESLSNVGVGAIGPLRAY